MYILKFIKSTLNKIGYYYYQIKCNVFFILQGGEGLSYVIENLPKNYIIPVLKSYGSIIGHGTDIDRGIILHRLTKKSDFRKISISNNSHLGHNMLLDLSERIEIGSYTAFGANCQIWTHTGNWTVDRSDEVDIVNPVVIGEAVICYSGVIISQNVTIGDYARVAGGSLLTKNVEANWFVGGVPAKFIKKIEK